MGGPGIAFGQSKVVLKDGRTQMLKILSVSGGNMQVQAGSSTTAVPVNQIASVDMAAPPEVEAARQALSAKDYVKALSNAKGVAEKFRGLPVDWARQVSALLGDVYLAMGDPGKAEAAYQEFQKAYPEDSTGAADLGLAQLAISRKDYDAASTKIEPILAKTGTTLLPPEGSAMALSRAFLLSGQIKEAKGDKQGALEDYLKTVTIYSADRVAVASAREKADALQKEKIAVP